MRRIIQANIARFKSLLEQETDPTKRAIESRLLAEEELLGTGAVLVPNAPMGRLYCDWFFCCSIDPIGSTFSARKYERVNFATVYHAYLKIAIGGSD